MLKVKRTDIKIKANHSRVLLLFFRLNKKRITDIISKIASLDDESVEKTINQVFHEFETRHIDFKDTILNNYQTIADKVTIQNTLPLPRKLLIGAYFTKEYSIEGAALFNPSIIIHPNQNGLSNGVMRFILSLRATGEGHISSIVFRTGLISQDGEISMDKVSDKLIAAKKNINLTYKKAFLANRAKFNRKINSQVFQYLPDKFTEQEAYSIIADFKRKKLFKFNETKMALYDIFETNYEVTFNENIPLSSKVIFPSSKAELMSMEDVRFVEFLENNKKSYIGTYTAYNGKDIRVQLIMTEDFNTFQMRSLYGKALLDKGMALFPEKINGKYAMIGRHGGNSISIMYSNDIYFWNDYKVIQKPEREWEITHLGNSGSPLKTPHGWLLLTHAVGPLRKYVLSATLLDLHDPEKVLASLDEPLLSPNSSEREGYVPNVVYTCGFIQHGENLLIPYAMSDSATSFATIKLNVLLEKLLQKIK